MSVSDVLWGEKNSILAAFHMGIVLGMVDTWKRCRGLSTTPQEPDLVAGLVLEGTPFMYAALKAILSPYRVAVSFAAAFCHQKPEVTYDPSVKSCELGDLLFVYVHTPKHGLCRRNALLFQAKMSAKQPYPIRSTERHQLRLYAEWPDFTYSRSSFLTGKSRSVNPKAPHAGAQYLLIDDRPPDDPASGLLGFPGTYPVGCCMPDESLHDHADLAAELFNLFLFRTGRPFEGRKTAGISDDWSQVVWDLIESAVKNSFNRKRSGFRGGPRISGEYAASADGLSFCCTSSSRSIDTVSEILGHGDASAFFAPGGDEPPRESERRSNGWESGAGVSLILIETSERPIEE